MYGFVADPSLSARHNACIVLAKMPVWYFFARPSNLGFHDLTQEGTKVPKNLASLLGLGLKFIPTPRTTPKWSKLETMSVTRLDRDLRLKSFFAGEPNNFEPCKMYIPSKWTPKPWLFPQEIVRRFHVCIPVL